MSLGIAMAAAVAAGPAGGEVAGVPPGAVSAASQAVTSYPPAFFAASQPNTALDMVTRLPGFTFDRGDTVRGFGGAAGNVLINGVRPAAKDDSLDEIIKRIPVSSVLRIDVIRGGAPGIDMQGKTVLANIVLRQDGGGHFTIAGSGSRWYDGRLGWGFRAEGTERVGKTDYEASLLMGRGIDDGSGNGPRTVRDATGALTQSSSEHSAGVGFNYKATAAVETPVLGGRLRLNGSLSSNPYDYLQDDHPTNPPGQDVIERDHQNQETAEIGLRYDRGLGAKASLETVLLQQLGRFDYTDNYSAAGDIEYFALNKDTGESIARTTVKFQPSTAVSLEAGGEGDYNWLNARTVYIVNRAPVSVPAANVQVTEARGEAFATATWRARPTLTLEAGLRAEYSHIGSTGDVVSGNSFFFPKPRAVVTWSPDDADQVRVRFEREVGQLNFDDFAAGSASLSNGSVHAGNPNLTPQQAWVVEGAYERRLLGSADATLTYRHYALSDVIDRAPIFDPSGTYDAPGNIGGGTKDELALSLTLPTDKFGLPRGQLTGQATWRWSSVTDPTTGQARPISGLHPVDAEAHFTQALPKWKSTWGFDVFDQWRETYYRFNEIDTDQLKVYVSMFGEYKPSSDLSMRFELENASGRGFEHTREVFLGPRNTSALSYVDVRALHSGRGLYFRVRKTFG